MEFSNEEMADMHFCYGLANGVSLFAQRLYQERFPNRRIPVPRTFDSLHRRLRENGSFEPLRGGIGRPQEERVINIEEIVLPRTEQNPEMSTGQLSIEYNISHMTVWRILHKAGLYPYHLQRVQALYPNDH